MKIKLEKTPKIYLTLEEIENIKKADLKHDYLINAISLEHTSYKCMNRAGSGALCIAAPNSHKSFLIKIYK